MVEIGNEDSLGELDRHFKEESNLRRFGTRTGAASLESKRNIEKFFDECDRDAEFINNSLKASDELTKKMVAILNSFENRLSQLENEISPIHEETTRLKTIHTNIEDSLRSIGEVLEVFEVGDKYEAKIKEGFPKTNSGKEFDSYLECLDQVSDAISYLNSHKNFKSTEKALVQMKTLRQTGLTFCDQAFSQLLIRDSLVIDPNARIDITKPLPESIELVRAEGVQELKKLVKRFTALNSQSYLKEYKERRGKFLASSLRKLSPEKIIKDDGQSKGTGVHSFIQFLQVCIVLFRSERVLAMDLIGEGYFDSVYFDLLASSVEMIVETGDAIIKSKRNVEKGFGVIGLIDIWSNWRDMMKQFKELFNPSKESEEGGKLFGELSELLDKFASSAKKCFEEFELYVKSDSKPLPPDGTVHELTSNVCLYLKNLFPYKDKTEVLLDPASTNKGKQSALGDFVLRGLSELKSSLYSKAKKQKEGILATVFLLNNFHYIRKTVQSSDLWTILPSQSQFTSEYDKAILEQRDIYRASWKPAIDYIRSDTTTKTPKDPSHLSSKEKKSIKSRFEGFNNEYEKMYNTQKSYFIPDSDLRKMIRDDIQMMLAEPYGKFYNSYSPLSFSKNKGKYVRYSYETVVNMLNKFFEGTQTETKKSKMFQFS